MSEASNYLDNQIYVVIRATKVVTMITLEVARATENLTMTT